MGRAACKLLLCGKSAMTSLESVQAVAYSEDQDFQALLDAVFTPKDQAALIAQLDKLETAADTLNKKLIQYP
jgi:hypothetical protein